MVASRGFASQEHVRDFHVGAQSDGTYLIKEMALCAYVLRHAEGASLSPESRRVNGGWLFFIGFDDDPEAGHAVIDLLRRKFPTSVEAAHDNMCRQIKVSMYGD